MNRKWTAIAILCMFTLLLCAGSAASMAASAPAAETPPPAGAAQATPAPGYGEEVRLEADQSGFAGTIAYPSGFLPLDTVLQNWANETLKAYQAKAQTEKADADGLRAELHVTYTAYELGNQFVSVKELGVYAASVSGTAESLLFTVNYNVDDEKLVMLTDAIGSQHIDAVAALLTERLMEGGNTAILGEKGLVTRDMMQNFLITAEGLSFLFSDGGNGYAECLLSYETLTPYLVLFNKAAAPAPATPPNTDKPAVIEEARCNTNGVRVRASASDKALTLAIVQRDAVLEVTKVDAGSGYSQIYYNGTLGYVKTAYLDLTAAPAPGITAEEKGYVTGADVHVRSSATTHSKILGTLKYGAEVEILTAYYTNSWHQIMYNGRVAYISAQYVSIGNRPAVTPAPERITPETSSGRPHIEFVGTCNADGVIIRAEPSIHADYYGKLYEDDEVRVVEEECKSGWDKVWIPSNHAHTKGYIGFVHSKYIDDLSQESAPPPDVRVTSAPVAPLPVIPRTPIPVITSNPGPAIGSGVTINP